MRTLCIPAVAILLLLSPSAPAERVAAVRAEQADDFLPGVAHCTSLPATRLHANEAGLDRMAEILRSHPEAPVPLYARGIFLRMLSVAKALPATKPRLVGYQSPRVMGSAVSSGIVLVSAATWTGDTALPDDELAAVFAHELAHLERNDIPRALCETLALAGDAAGGTREATAALMRRIAGGDMNLALHWQLGNHAREFAADRRAVELLVLAGYDGGAMARVLRKLARDGVWDASFTHPALDVRLEQAQAVARGARR
jgi:Zn-dependent protease with chaperone function